MYWISNKLEEVNRKRSSNLDAATLLQRLGFKILKSDDISHLVNLPDGWTYENQGTFHTVFHGPNDEEVWSFIKNDPWDRHSFLQARNIKMGE